MVRIGLGYVKGVRKEEMEALVTERERGGSYRGIADLASRSGASRDALERLAWAGALGDRRKALWEVGVVGTGRRHDPGTQMALPLETSDAPTLEPLGEWGEVIANYGSTGMTLGEHPMALMREGLDRELLRSTDLEKVEDGAIVEVAGMVVARQRPETAKGIVFMLLEDERGTVNLIVPPQVYDRHRAEVRTSPLVRAKGKLERREGTTNVLVSAVVELHREPAKSAPSEPPSRDRAATQLRAVAPAGHRFGRRG